MRVVSERQLTIVLGALTGTPMVVVGGNFASPWRALALLDGTLARYRLFALNAQAGMPNREGVTFESPFVGPGMRGRSELHYFPCRLSLVPALLSEVLPPDVVLVQTSAPSHGTVSLGTEVNVLPAAIEAARSRGGLVIAQRAGPGPAGHRVVRIRQHGPLRMDGPQPGRANAPDRDGQRPGADRPAAADDLCQRRAAVRPVGSGQRDMGQRESPFRDWRADGFRGRRAALPRRPGDHRAPVLAP